MKTKLLFLKTIIILLVICKQNVFAQTGGAFNGPHNALNQIYFRDFDLGVNENKTVNPNGVAPYGYSDATAGNTAGNGTSFLNNNYRPGTDVDMAAPASGFSEGVIALNSGSNEYLYYTVTFAQDGKYHIDVNYGHSNANPRGIKFELLDEAFTNTPKVLANGSLVRTISSVTYGDATNGESINPVTDRPTNAPSTENGNTIQFDVVAGTYVIKITTINNGPNYVWFQFKRDGDASLGVNDINKEEKKIKAFPNPSNDGQFNLNIYTKWEVYSLLGSKIAQGEGTKVNLSNTAKGIYILKTAYSSNKLILK